MSKNECDNSDLLLHFVYKTFKSSSFVSRGSTFSGSINCAKPFQVWQKIFLVLNVNLVKERLVVRRRPSGAPLTASPEF